MTVKSIGLFGNPEKAEIVEAVHFIQRHCDKAGVHVFLTRHMAQVAGDADCLKSEELVDAADVIMALGGDGTMLQAARLIGATGAPLLGINLGSLGYLTDVPFQELERALQQLLAGEFHLEERMRVGCTALRKDATLAAMQGLNDIVVNMGPLPRALDLELQLAGESLGRFLGDGIIVSSPTGSTAYNLSAGGPICHPDVSCLLVTPICPHSLGMRHLIVPDDIEIELVLHDVGQGAKLTADGQLTENLVSGDRLVFRVADSRVRLVKFPQSIFYRVLRHKLAWGAPKRLNNGR